MNIKELLQKKNLIFQEVVVNGWVRSFRSNRFIILNDGSTFKNLQIIIMESNFSKKFLRKIQLGVALLIKGIITISIGKKQLTEVVSTEIKIYNKISISEINKTILQPKRHKLDTLREQAHLRFRTKLFSSIMRIRHQLSFCIHEYFYYQGFFYIHTPIITSSDAEGIGDMFIVTHLNLNSLPKNDQKCIDHTKDFFGHKTYLSVSGQLEGETAAISLGQIYTFGPSFRAENSNTLRHLSEFWMIEPEMAFYDIIDNMNLAEDFLKYLIKKILKKCKEDIYFLNSKESTLLIRLQLIVDHSFCRISYTEAIIILTSQPKIKHFIQWGSDLQSEHERYLIEYFCRPIILLDAPAQVKAFYMRLNNDKSTVSSMDILFPLIGEVIGGSQREERYELLLNRMQILGIHEESYWWYLDIRRFGSAPHSGFGLGFDRLVQFITGMVNIRDVIPFPRTPKNAEF